MIIEISDDRLNKEKITNAQKLMEMGFMVCDNACKVTISPNLAQKCEKSRKKAK